MKPDQGQSQWSHTADRVDNKGFLEIPRDHFLWKALMVGGGQKLTTMFTFYRFVLNFFSAERTLFHYRLLFEKL
jgi:hypothetical protein